MKISEKGVEQERETRNEGQQGDAMSVDEGKGRLERLDCSGRERSKGRRVVRGGRGGNGVEGCHSGGG